MATVLHQYQPTPFMGSHEREVWHLNSTFDSFHSANSVLYLVGMSNVDNQNDCLPKAVNALLTSVDKLLGQFHVFFDEYKG
uniref:Uncharacterized protein n=1 Tax=Acrobeloides nanus TaxID=290746 RepID=A0A914DHQ2_9BILA